MLPYTNQPCTSLTRPPGPNHPDAHKLAQRFAQAAKRRHQASGTGGVGGGGGGGGADNMTEDDQLALALAMSVEVGVGVFARPG